MMMMMYFTLRHVYIFIRIFIVCRAIFMLVYDEYKFCFVFPFLFLQYFGFWKLTYVNLIQQIPS